MDEQGGSWGVQKSFLAAALSTWKVSQSWQNIFFALVQKVTVSFYLGQITLDGGRHRGCKVIVQCCLDGLADRLHLVGVDGVGAYCLQLAQVRVEVLLGGCVSGFGVVGWFHMVPKDGDDVATEVLVVGAQTTTSTCTTVWGSAILAILNKMNYFYPKNMKMWN